MPKPLQSSHHLARLQALSLAAAVSVSALSPSSRCQENVSRRQEPVIYGEDDRLDVFEVASDVLRQRAARSTVAFIYEYQIPYQRPGSATLSTPTQQTVYDLCDGEPFAEQIAEARCSGVLIDDDLVLTAGHCLGTDRTETLLTCSEMAFVFGYLYEEPGILGAITADDVFHCRDVVAWNFDEQNLDAPDYGIIQLDRSAIPRMEPAPIRSQPAEFGERVNLIGFGARLPAKVDRGGFITDTKTYSEYFGATTDTFEGASGSPLYDDAGNLVAIHSRGAPDWEYTRGCTSVAYQSSGADEHQYVATPIEALCNLSWPSHRLCGGQVTCGDRVCSPGESPASCSRDCSEPSCGDGVCEGEEVTNCQEDCNPYQALPTDWYCPPYYWGDEQGCDCDCGGLDPDCADPRQEQLGCDENESCNAAGECTPPPPADEGCSVAQNSPPGHRGHLAISLVAAALFWRRRPKSSVLGSRR